MAWKDKYGRNVQYRGGRIPTKHIIVTNKELAKLFNKSIYTIRKWIKKGYLDPSSLENIVEKYNSRKNKSRDNE